MSIPPAPAATPQAPFTYYLRVRYIECDAQKVVFNSRYGEYVDAAMTEFIRAIGFREQLVSGELDFQLVKQTTEWKAPARFDQVLAVSVAPRHLGNTSFTLITEFRLADDERLIAVVETVYVLVDAATLQKTPLPPAFRAALEAGARGTVTDHAGAPRPIAAALGRGAE
jgi:acyl-CoA thioester hydrolase